MSVSMILSWTNRLKQYGVLAQVVEGELKVKLPQTLAPEAKPLLKELKRAMDQEQAYKLFESASVRVSKAFSPAAWDRARDNNPELLQVIVSAEQDYTKAYRQRDMVGCREAVDRYEKGFSALNDAYRQEVPDT